MDFSILSNSYEDSSVNQNNRKNSISDDDILEDLNVHTNDDQDYQSNQDQMNQQCHAILSKLRKKEKTIFKLFKSNKSQKFDEKSQQQNNNNFYMKRELLNYNRKEKSLEELSKRFLSLFLDKDESLLSLDKITEQLGVERRRIYDIINILESLRLVTRKGKNNYKWNGFKKIYETIQEYTDKVQDVQKEDIDENENSPTQKREKSLEMLSIGFLRLFIHWKSIMTLEEAARKLSSENLDSHKIKTKIRRLYDISNVFKSLGLVKKTCLDTKKPAFQWVGINGIDEFVSTMKNEKSQSSVQNNLHPKVVNFNQLQNEKNNLTPNQGNSSIFSGKIKSKNQKQFLADKNLFSTADKSSSKKISDVSSFNQLTQLSFFNQIYMMLHQSPQQPQQQIFNNGNILAFPNMYEESQTQNVYGKAFQKFFPNSLQNSSCQQVSGNNANQNSMSFSKGKPPLNLMHQFQTAQKMKKELENSYHSGDKQLVTPIIKKTLTIIPPKSDEPLQALTPKRCFSENLSNQKNCIKMMKESELTCVNGQQNNNVLTDKTNITLNQCLPNLLLTKRNNSFNNGNFSSFKKIKKDEELEVENIVIKEGNKLAQNQDNNQIQFSQLETNIFNNSNGKINKNLNLSDIKIEQKQQLPNNNNFNTGYGFEERLSIKSFR